MRYLLAILGKVSQLLAVETPNLHDILQLLLHRHPFVLWWVLIPIPLLALLQVTCSLRHISNTLFCELEDLCYSFFFMHGVIFHAFHNFHHFLTSCVRTSFHCNRAHGCTSHGGIPPFVHFFFH